MGQLREPGTLRGRRILVVEDDPHTRTLLRDLCESLRMHVTLAEDGERGLELAIAGGELAPELVLLDLMLPLRDGFSVLEAIRSAPSGEHLPVILLTAMSDLDGKLRGMELGATDYVTKPFKLVELQTRMQAALLVSDYRERLTAVENELGELRALDPLTGAGTWSQVKVSLDGELARSRRYNRPSAVLLFGLDDYASLRARLGPEGLDGLVRSFAIALKASLRAADRLFRLDLDEFVVLQPETDLRGARTAAERLSAAIRDVQASTPSGPVPLQVRIAGASFPHSRVQTSEDLLREASRVHRALRELGPEKRIFEL